MPKLFIFGLGYSAKRIAQRAQSLGWEVVATGSEGKLSFDDTDAVRAELSRAGPGVRVWDPVVRLFHWLVVVGCLLDLAILEEGEAPHRWVGYVVAGALAGSLGYIIAGWQQAGLPPQAWGYVYWPAALGIVVASVLTAPLGARLAHRLSPRLLQRGFALLLILLGAKMLLGL